MFFWNKKSKNNNKSAPKKIGVYIFCILATLMIVVSTIAPLLSSIGNAQSSNYQAEQIARAEENRLATLYGTDNSQTSIKEPSIIAQTTADRAVQTDEVLGGLFGECNKPNTTENNVFINCARQIVSIAVIVSIIFLIIRVIALNLGIIGKFGSGENPVQESRKLIQRGLIGIFLISGTWLILTVFNDGLVNVFNLRSDYSQAAFGCIQKLYDSPNDEERAQAVRDCKTRVKTRTDIARLVEALEPSIRRASQAYIESIDRDVPYGPYTAVVPKSNPEYVDSNYNVIEAIKAQTPVNATQVYNECQDGTYATGGNPTLDFLNEASDIMCRVAFYKYDNLNNNLPRDEAVVQERWALLTLEMYSILAERTAIDADYSKNNSINALQGFLYKVKDQAPIMINLINQYEVELLGKFEGDPDRQQKVKEMVDIMLLVFEEKITTKEVVREGFEFAAQFIETPWMTEESRRVAIEEIGGFIEDGDYELQAFVEEGFDILSKIEINGLPKIVTQQLAIEARNLLISGRDGTITNGDLLSGAVNMAGAIYLQNYEQIDPQYRDTFEFALDLADNAVEKFRKCENELFKARDQIEQRFLIGDISGLERENLLRELEGNCSASALSVVSTPKLVKAGIGLAKTYVDFEQFGDNADIAEALYDRTTQILTADDGWITAGLNGSITEEEVLLDLLSLGRIAVVAFYRNDDTVEGAKIATLGMNFAEDLLNNKIICDNSQDKTIEACQGVQASDGVKLALDIGKIAFGLDGKNAALYDKGAELIVSLTAKMEVDESDPNHIRDQDWGLAFLDFGRTYLSLYPIRNSSGDLDAPLNKAATSMMNLADTALRRSMACDEAVEGGALRESVAACNGITQPELAIYIIDTAAGIIDIEGVDDATIQAGADLLKYFITETEEDLDGDGYNGLTEAEIGLAAMRFGRRFVTNYEKDPNNLTFANFALDFVGSSMNIFEKALEKNVACYDQYAVLQRNENERARTINQRNIANNNPERVTPAELTTANIPECRNLGVSATDFLGPSFDLAREYINIEGVNTTAIIDFAEKIIEEFSKPNGNEAEGENYIYYNIGTYAIDFVGQLLFDSEDLDGVDANGNPNIQKQELKALYDASAVFAKTLINIHRANNSFPDTPTLEATINYFADLVKIRVEDTALVEIVKEAVLSIITEADDDMKDQRVAATMFRLVGNLIPSLFAAENDQDQVKLERIVRSYTELMVTATLTPKEIDFRDALLATSYLITLEDDNGNNVFPAYTARVLSIIDKLEIDWGYVTEELFFSQEDNSMVSISEIFTKKISSVSDVDWDNIRDAGLATISFAEELGMDKSLSKILTALATDITDTNNLVVNGDLDELYKSLAKNVGMILRELDMSKLFGDDAARVIYAVADLPWDQIIWNNQDNVGCFGYEPTSGDDKECFEYDEKKSFYDKKLRDCLRSVNTQNQSRGPEDQLSQAVICRRFQQDVNECAQSDPNNPNSDASKDGLCKESEPGNRICRVASDKVDQNTQLQCSGIVALGIIEQINFGKLIGDLGGSSELGETIDKVVDFLYVFDYGCPFGVRDEADVCQSGNVSEIASAVLNVLGQLDLESLLGNSVARVARSVIAEFPVNVFTRGFSMADVDNFAIIGLTLADELGADSDILGKVVGYYNFFVNVISTADSIISNTIQIIDYIKRIIPLVDLLVCALTISDYNEALIYIDRIRVTFTQDNNNPTDTECLQNFVDIDSIINILNDIAKLLDEASNLIDGVSQLSTIKFVPQGATPPTN